MSKFERPRPLPATRVYVSPNAARTSWPTGAHRYSWRMTHRRQYQRPRPTKSELPLGVSIGLWIVVLALVASGVWMGFGLTDLFVWTDQADRVQYSFVLAGGIGAVAALVVSYRKQKLAEASAILDLESHFGSRFLAATEQLGNPTPTVRMAGALSLARLADDWVAQRQMVVDVITAYLRMPSPENEGAEDEIRASLFRTIRDHLRPSASPDWQGLKFDFTSAELTGADFTEIEMRTGTSLNFTDTTFSRGFVRLSGNFAGDALAFTRAKFCGAIVEIGGEISVNLLDFEGATISSGALRMEGITFTGKEISFRQLSIREGTLSIAGSSFKTQSLSFGGMSVQDQGSFLFHHCNVVSGDLDFVSAHLMGQNAYFVGTTFTGRRLLFSGTRFAAANVCFAEINFEGEAVDFSGATFLGPKVDFHKAVIHPKSLIVGDAACVEGVVDWGRLDAMRDAFNVFEDESALLTNENALRSSRIEHAMAAFAQQRHEEA